MNDKIIDFYLQVSGELCDGKEWCIGGVGEPLRRFADLVAAAERKACATLVETLLGENPDLSEVYVAAEIRERGQE